VRDQVVEDLPHRRVPACLDPLLPALGDLLEVVDQQATVVDGSERRVGERRDDPGRVAGPVAGERVEVGRGVGEQAG
jgi:hypothetical protein